MLSVLAFDLGGVLFTDGTGEFIEYLHRTLGVDPARAGDLLNGALGSYHDVYYLSDNVAERIEAVERRYDFLRLFRGGVFSHEVGVRKPNRGIYELLVERTRVEARQILFVDDKDWALVPAAQLGMTTVLFRDSEQVRHELRRLGVCG